MVKMQRAGVSALEQDAEKRLWHVILSVAKDRGI